ncbi:HNH endonuclease [Mycobacterium sp. CnD-18-1]|uniref:HNH endonuclease n=1 Tax=Mycobacterium sp. CnD-18-1 TaxID=2917744 RepID=UPI0035B0D5AD
MNLNDLPKQLRSRISVSESGCWIWDSVRRDGYTQVQYLGRKWLTHRLTYTLLVGAIAEGDQIDHLCRVQRCVNPSHLESVTPLVNTRRSHGNYAKTHCPQGHEYTPENTINYDQRLHRECRKCKYERNASYIAARPDYRPPSRRKKSVLP